MTEQLKRVDLLRQSDKEIEEEDLQFQLKEDQQQLEEDLLATEKDLSKARRELKKSYRLVPLDPQRIIELKTEVESLERSVEELKTLKSELF